MRLAGMPRMSDLVKQGSGCSTYEFWARVGRRNKLKEKLIEQWKEAGLDAVVCPGLGLPAWPHGMSAKLNQACSYTFVWNNLHFPAGTVPITMVRPNEEEYNPGPFKDTLSADAASSCKGSAGLP